VPAMSYPPASGDAEPMARRRVEGGCMSRTPFMASLDE